MEDNRISVKLEQDSELLARFVSDGDEDAFVQIVERYKELVWGICQRRLANQADAEDAFQATFVLLATNGKRIRKRNSLGSWLFGCAIRICRQIANRRKFDSVNEFDLECRQNGPFQEIADRHERQLLDEQIRSIGEHHRVPLLMYYYQGMSYSEIAQQMGLTISAVQGRLRRGRGLLRQRLVRLGIPVGILGSVSLTGVPLRGSLVNQTVKASIGENAVGAGASMPIVDLNSGARIMLLKSITVAGLISLGTLGAVVQQGIFQAPPSVATSLELPIQSFNIQPQIVAVAKQDIRSDEEKSTGQTDSWLQAMHHHLISLHQRANQDESAGQSSQNDLHADDLNQKPHHDPRNHDLHLHAADDDPRHHRHADLHRRHDHFDHSDHKNAHGTQHDQRLEHGEHLKSEAQWHGEHRRSIHRRLHEHLHSHSHAEHDQDGDWSTEEGSDSSYMRRLHDHLGQQHEHLTNQTQAHLVRLLQWMHGNR